MIIPIMDINIDTVATNCLLHNVVSPKIKITLGIMVFKMPLRFRIPYKVC